MKSINDIKIVKYEHKYAEATAIMWQNSCEGWMGDEFLTTADAVICDEENSNHLFAWLALDGELVVGYVNLYEYQEDTGALYIGLLNVRDDYHGKKIGKKLVLTAVNKTIELGWDRLDLYTWTGNTKAVPLYKKCGFFWEDRDETTHLLNLIPASLKNDLVKDKFKVLDWYADSKRKLETVPDGIKDNEFEYLQYEWENDSEYLLMEYCRRSKGLRRLETKEFKITTTTENLKLVFGQKYQIKYEIQNKTEKPLKIKLNGINEKNIKFDYSSEFEVIGEKVVYAEFFVDSIEKEQNPWKNHPNVLTEISVNDQTCCFGNSVLPQFPALLDLTNRSGLAKNNAEMDLFIDIENRLDKPANFRFELPENDKISLTNNQFDIQMKENEKKSIPVKAMVKKGGVYSPKIKISVSGDNISDFDYSKSLSLIINTYLDKFEGDTPIFKVVGNGTYRLVYRVKEFLNEMHFVNTITSQGLFFKKPMLGKPYSDEFNHKLCDNLSYSEEENAILLKADYSSDKVKGLDFVINYRLFQNGIMERWIDFSYNGNKATEIEICFKDMLKFPMNRTILPLKNKFVRIKENQENGAFLWKADDFTENWFYSEANNIGFGFFWEKGMDFKLGDWEKFFEINLGILNPGDQYSSPKVTYCNNTFNDWHQFRQFAIGKSLKREQLVDDFYFEVNDGNPFIENNLLMEIIDFKQVMPERNFDFSSKSNFFSSGSQNFTKESKNTQINLGQVNNNSLIDILKVKSKYGNRTFFDEKSIISYSKNPIVTGKEIIDNKEILFAENGLMKLKASKDYAPTIYSLEYRSDEWLDNSFPEPTAKAWWKPWFGGLYILPSQIKEKTLLEESFDIGFVRKKDNFNNEWSGIEITIKFEKNEKLKGIVLKQYYLMLPNSPVLYLTTEMLQNSGKYMRVNYMNICGFIKPDNILSNSYYSPNPGHLDEIKVYAGKSSYELKSKGFGCFGSDNKKTKMYVKSISPKPSLYLEADSQILSSWNGEFVYCENGKSKQILSHFYIFSDMNHQKEHFVDLNNIRLVEDS